MTDLKPCPVCGSEARIDAISPRMKIRCSNSSECGIFVRRNEDEVDDQVVARWNSLPRREEKSTRVLAESFLKKPDDAELVCWKTGYRVLDNGDIVGLDDHGNPTSKPFKGYVSDEHFEIATERKIAARLKAHHE
jgi:hypothetical protein